MKKLLSLVLVAVMIVSMTACGGSSEPAAQPIEEPTVPTTASAEPTEAATAPQETEPEDPIQALALTDTEKQALEHARAMGFSMEKVDQEVIRAAELAVLTDQFVSYAAPDRLEEWKEMFPAFRRSTQVLNRMDAMTMVFLLANTLGGEYVLANLSYGDMYKNEEAFEFDWNTNYVDDWDLFGGYEAVNQKDYTMGYPEVFPYADQAAYIFMIGKQSYVSYEFLFSYDPVSNSLRPADDCTYAEALIAMARLYEANYENIES